MPMLADLIDAVVGVDTHRDTHHVEIALPTGTPIATCSITNDTSGYAQLLAWILEHAPGPRIAVSIEGTRSYGIGLARAATAAGLLVLECEQPHRKTRRGKGKSDPIDAHLAVLTALRLEHQPTAHSPRRRRPRSPTHPARRPPRADRDQHRADQPAPRTTTRRPRRHRSPARPRSTHRRHPHPPGPPSPLPRRQPRTGHPPRRDPPPRPGHPRRPPGTQNNRAQLQSIVDDLAPGLTQRPGIGPVTAAQAIVAFSHPGRCRNDAAFASLAGTCPIPASSGRTVRHRLNRGGDRALNRAIHTITTVRMRDCPATKAYIARRTAEGKTIREIKRCLKRYITRQLYRTLTASMTPTTNNPAVA